MFICTGITPSVAVDAVKKPSTAISDKSVIIVDDEGDGDYTSIKEALSYANPDDTIEVYSGIYYEHTIVIETENITLEGISHELGNGSDTGKPFIDGPGTDPIALIDIKADGVTINSFRIENYNGGGAGNVCIGIDYDANKCVISNNDIAHSLCSLIWIFGSDNMILDNNISHSVIRQGIVLCDPCSYCLVSGNVISDVEIGIDLWDSNHNTVTGNWISRCRDFGIDIASSNVNTVKGNIFEDNTVGIHIYISRFNTLEGNTFEDNIVGVYIDKSLGSRIKNNNFIDNQLQAQFIYGLFVYGITNRWNGNYWNETRSTPYPIRGAYILFPCVQFDWRPAKEAYKIEGVI